MNARAAWRLERLGFPQVYRYAPGKADWLAAGLPTEGRTEGALRAGTVARRDIPTCRPDDRVADVAARVRQVGNDVCVVINEERVVLGRLRKNALDEGSDDAVENVMEDGPTTTRANDDLLALTTRLHDHDVASIIVTDPDGRLIGITYRDDADALLCREPDRPRQ